MSKRPLICFTRCQEVAPPSMQILKMAVTLVGKGGGGWGGAGGGNGLADWLLICLGFGHVHPA